MKDQKSVDDGESKIDKHNRAVDIFIESFPSTTPEGSNLVKVNASTNSSSGTPYCNAIDMAIAKLFISDLNAAPSLCISIKISPTLPSSYSPVRK